MRRRTKRNNKDRRVKGGVELDKELEKVRGGALDGKHLADLPNGGGH